MKYKYLMSTVYFPVSKYHLTNINMKKSSNTDHVVNKKSVEISNELGQSLLDCRFIQTLVKIVNLNLSQEDLMK